MRTLRGLFMLMLLFCGSTGWAQPTLHEWLSTSTSRPEEKELAYQRVKTLIASVREDSANSHKALQRMFHKVHKTLLRRYEAYADFHTIFTEGTYDCLTATTLFSYMLTALNYEFKVIETNYHIFILVQTSRGQVMLESTDRLGGFVTDERLIASRTGDYKKNVFSAERGDHLFYQYTFSLYQEVSPEKLTGLLLYNQAVRAYNRGEWLSCARMLEKANAAYTNPRCEELGDILVHTIIGTKVPAVIRQECLSHLKSVIMSRATTVAVN